MLDPSDLERCVKEIKQGKLEINQQSNFANWAKEALNQGVNELLFMIHNIDLLGQSAVLDTIVKVSTNVGGINRLILAGALGSVTILGLLKAVALAAALVSAPKDVKEGLPLWQSAGQTALDATRSLLAPPPLQIEGPKTKTGELNRRGRSKSLTVRKQ